MESSIIAGRYQRIVDNNIRSYITLSTIFHMVGDIHENTLQQSCGRIVKGRKGWREKKTFASTVVYIPFFHFYDRLYGVNWGFLAWMDDVLEAKRLGRLIMDNILK